MDFDGGRNPHRLEDAHPKAHGIVRRRSTITAPHGPPPPPPAAEANVGYRSTPTPSSPKRLRQIALDEGTLRRLLVSRCSSVSSRPIPNEAGENTSWAGHGHLTTLEKQRWSDGTGSAGSTSETWIHMKYKPVTVILPIPSLSGDGLEGSTNECSLPVLSERPWPDVLPGLDALHSGVRSAFAWRTHARQRSSSQVRSRTKVPRQHGNPDPWRGSPPILVTTKPAGVRTDFGLQPAVSWR